MHWITKAMVFTLLLTVPSTGVAHEGMQHKGKPVEGEVVTIASDRLTLKTEKGTVIVVLDDKTKVERGNRPASRGELKAGDRLAVFGTRLATGELVASDVVIGGVHDEATEGQGKHDMPGAHRD